MKAVINGKRYNTDTATCVESNAGGQGRSDFRWFSEALYKTPRGNWFLAGEGGPMTRWARSVQNGNGYTDGSGIIPFDAAEAREWLESNGMHDEIEAHFDIEDA